MSCQQGYNNATDCKRHRFGIITIWDLGIRTCYRRIICSAVAKSAIVEDAGQRQFDPGRGRSSFPLRKTADTFRVADLLENNANEGPNFTPQNIFTEDDFVDFLKKTYPLFTSHNISQILHYYPSTNSSVSNTPKFATSGNSTPTAVNESTFGTGQQQRADVISFFIPRPLPVFFLRLEDHV